MSEQFGGENNIEQRFKSPDEELKFLRAEVTRHEKALAEKNETLPRDEIIRNRIEEHKERRVEDVLDKDYALKNNEVQSIVLQLSPEQQDYKMAEIVNILQEKGVLNALSVLKLNARKLRGSLSKRRLDNISPR